MSGITSGSSTTPIASSQVRQDDEGSTTHTADSIERYIPEGEASAAAGKERTVTKATSDSGEIDEEREIENLKAKIPSIAEKLWLHSLRDNIEKLKNNEAVTSISRIEIRGQEIYPRDDSVSDEEYYALLDEIAAALPDQRNDIDDSEQEKDYMKSIQENINLLHQLLLNRYNDKDKEESLEASLKVLRPLVQKTFSWSSNTPEQEEEPGINMQGQPSQATKDHYNSLLDELKTHHRFRVPAPVHKTDDDDDPSEYASALSEQPPVPPAPVPPPMPSQDEVRATMENLAREVASTFHAGNRQLRSTNTAEAAERTQNPQDEAPLSLQERLLKEIRDKVPRKE
ncbi:hypothetical protein ElyMa_004393000 [Elysia marginata]|uniref:Fibrous sheath-interacting protein 1 n=1 Tax=Elysia marginata TaxID=1093978 RepID=A0AAV4HB97_9GAST|nr:hypothetical protein ElyMa_004393000 [Elysia marginata]